MRDEALAAIAAAADLDALARAKAAHTGGTSPLALANREIGALPPHAKAEAGKRVGQARGAVNKALAARQGELEAERDARVLVEEAVDVTLPYDRVPPGARHPLTTLSDRIEDIFVGHGLRGGRGPRGRGRVVQLRRAELPARPPGARDAGHLLRRGAARGSVRGLVLRTHTSPVQIRALLERELPVYVIAPAGSTAPTSWTPPTPRCSSRSNCSRSTRA